MKCRIIFLGPYPLHHSPSQRFRFEQYLSFFPDRYEIKFFPFLSEAGWRNIYLEGKYIRKSLGLLRGILYRWYQLLLIIPFADMVFIHREAAPLGPPIFEWIVAKIFRKKIIYDFDDAIWIPNISDQNRMAAWLKCHWKVKHIIRWSHKVSCGNHFLAEYARQFNKNVVYNPTTIDTGILHNPASYDRPKNSIPIIGWTGTHSTLKYLDLVMPVLHELEREMDFEFRVISNQAPKNINLKNYQFFTWNESTEIQHLICIDIGIMPLTPDLWSAGKCGFKALQYMALEIPAVVADVGVNSEIVTHGVEGYVCKAPGEWISALKELLESSEKRMEMGKKGRKKVLKAYSVASNRDNFLSLFE